MGCLFKPYEGYEPYIFISYSRADARIVFSIMSELHKKGFRIWYDECIEWEYSFTQDIARHIENCSATMFFVSKTSFASAKFQNEIIHAFNLRKNILPICLETVPVPPYLNQIFQSLSMTNSVVNFCDYEKEPERHIKQLCGVPILQPAKAKRFNVECSFKPYEGDEPYLFISYSHDDTPTVFSIMEDLNKAGFRIWYDKGIEWGITWTADLAMRIERCGIVMVFISQTSIISPHCQNEIVHAYNNKKYFFPVYLKPVALPSPLSQILEHIQAAKFYEYANDREKFIERLVEANILQPSRGKASAQWFLDHGIKHFNKKNYSMAFEYLRQAAKSTNVVTQTIAADYIKKILNEADVFKRRDEANEKYFKAYISRPPAPYPNDKPK